jgi:hypothetical protein
MTDVAQTDNTAAEPTTPDTVDATGTNGGTQDTVTLTQAELQKRIDDSLKDRLDREREKANKLAEKARKEAEANALKENEQFKTLAEQYEGRVKELEPQAARVEALESVITGLLEGRLKELDPTAKDAVADLPTDDPLVKLQWLNKHGARYAKPAAPNLNARERSGDGKTMSDVERQELATMLGVDPRYLP